MTKQKKKEIFKPIFSRHVDVNKMAFMNWRMSNYADIPNILNIADGFLSSAILLANACVKSNKEKRADILIFPILTNANHGIELYLKGIIWTLNKLINSPDKMQRGHNIDQLYRTVRSKVREFGGEGKVKHFDEAMSGLDVYIKELCLKIKATTKEDKMDFSRYPFNNKYDNHFYVNEFSNVEVDLPNFIKRFKKVNTSLEDYSEYLYYGCLSGESEYL